MMAFLQQWAEEGVGQEVGQEVEEDKVQQQGAHLRGEEVRKTSLYTAVTDFYFFKRGLFWCFHQVEICCLRTPTEKK